MRIALHRYDLPLAHPFTISRGTITVQPTMIVELEQDGVTGYGEATTNDYYGITWESMADALESVRGAVESRRLEPLLPPLPLDDHRTPPLLLPLDGGGGRGVGVNDPSALWNELDENLRTNRFAQAALDLAAHDLWGKLAGKPVYELWRLDLSHVPESNYTIGIDSLDVMVAKLHERADWPIYKIKLGTPDDVAIVRELRKHTDATFRVDANCAWSVDETVANSEALAPLGVEFIEQPLPAYTWRESEEVYRRSALPIIADESCQIEADVRSVRGRFHGVNVKLPKCGGLTPAKRMIEEARQLGLKTMVGCMTESTVGISAIAQLLPLLDYVDMDGAALLASDIADGVRVERGVAHFPKTPGCGVTLR
jgi:L-alanine-DL-glutamate epimerase-like enolase superfamily enzyme